MLGVQKAGIVSSDDILFGSSDWNGISRLTEQDKIFFLSVRELADYVGNYNGAPGLAAEHTTGSSDDWWLRSPYAYSTAIVIEFWGNASYTYLSYNRHARPAFNNVAVTAVTLSGAVRGDDISVDTDGLTGTISSANAGTCAEATLPALTQPTGAVSTTVTINPLSITVTPDSGQSKEYGAARLSADVHVFSQPDWEQPTERRTCLCWCECGITYGLALSDSTLTGGAGSVPGTFAWTDGTVKANAGTPQYEMTFTHTDTTNYDTAKTSVTVTVAKATPTLTYTVTGLMSGETLATEATLTCDADMDTIGRYPIERLSPEEATTTRPSPTLRGR